MLTGNVRVKGQYDTISEKVKQMNPPYMCGDCLCRVCARNECGDNFAEGIDNDCLGCNGCNGTVDLLEDCPKEAFVPDDE